MAVSYLSDLFKQSIKVQMFKQGNLLRRRKIDGCFFQKNVKQNVSCHRKTLPRRGFILKSLERPYVPLKNGTRGF